MNFLADESVDRQILDRLRRDGHRIWYVAEMEPGIPDDVVLDLANREESVLLTADKDFGELVFRQRRVNLGVVLIRLAGLSPEHKAEVVAAVVKQRAGQLEHSFAVIAPGMIRLRRGPEI